MKYVKKRIQIDAARYYPVDPKSYNSACNARQSVALSLNVKVEKFEILYESVKEQYVLVISTLEGEMVANPGDWIIKGVENELYPCKDSIFQETYERAETCERAEAE